MSVKQAAQLQYQGIVDRAAAAAGNLRVPPEGWLRTVRKALGMSGAQLARRMKVSRAAVGQTERSELAGGVTLKAMEAAAEAMGCRFVYAIVPDGTVEDLVTDQARRKVEKLVGIASKHMALESQTLPEAKIKDEIARQIRNMLVHMPSDFWDDK